MRSFDEWNDDLPDDGSQPDLPFGGNAPAASSEENEPVKSALGRGPLEELFDAFARGEEPRLASVEAPSAARVEEPPVVQVEAIEPLARVEAPLPPPPSQVIVETEVVSLPVALVLQPRESVALVPVPVVPRFDPSPADASPWLPQASLDDAPFEAAIGEAAEPTVILPVVAEAAASELELPEPASEEPALPEAILVEAALAALTPPEPVQTKVARPEPVEPVLAKAALTEVSLTELALPKPENLAHALPEPVFIAAKTLEEPAPIVAKEPVAPPMPPPPPAIPMPLPVAAFAPPAPAPVAPVALAAIAVKPPIAIKIKETPKVEPPPAPEPVAHIPEPAVAAAESAKSGGMGRLFAAAAAIVIIVGAIGIPMGKLWAGRQTVNVVTPQAEAHAAPAVSQPREKRVEPVSAPVAQPAAAVVEHVTVAPSASGSVSAAAAKPKPQVTTPSRPIASLPTPAVASPAAAVLSAAAVAAPIPVTPTPLAMPPTPEPAAAAPSAEAPPPVGPFFEMAQVDKAPRVATRVAPQLPADTQAKLNDIALVRVLVSQAGHPVLVRMLRPSKGGLAADDAVMAAVKKWTFTPALKKGETVTCWLHVAVPLR